MERRCLAHPYVYDTWDAQDYSDSFNVFHVATDGTDRRDVTDYAPGSYDLALYPAWSPEGETIVFDLRHGTDVVDVWRVAADGSTDPILVIEDAQDPDLQPLPPT